MTRPSLLPMLAASLLLLQPLPAPAQQQPIRGFPRAMLEAQAEREARLNAVPDADTLRARMMLLAGEPHVAGTPRSRVVAELIRDRFRAAGLNAQLEVVEALMPMPVSRRLELLSPERYTARLEESAIAEDPYGTHPGHVPTFNAYSADGDVTAELVFVNYGTPEDYAVLDSLGISVAGKIVLAKYGRSWRGIKPKMAAERGAVGTLIYSDPRDDGYWVEDVYPVGPMRPWTGVQRGSVMDMPLHPGDPLSPGWGSEPGSRRLDISEARTIMSIPVMPISYEDALPLLRNLGGPLAPEAWRGALPVTYRIGAGPARVRLALEFDWRTRPLYNPVARIPGALYPDEWIVYGNHHDAWGNGAADPISGMIAVEEVARALGQLLRTGWRPARTIVLAGWDGEEWGLLGSTEWAEKHQRELRDKGVVYFNTDSNNRGWIGVGGSHSLQTFMTEVARDVRDPQRGTSTLEAWYRRRQQLSRDTIPGRPVPVRPDTMFAISALGSGSDYTVFLDFLGLASINTSFGGESPAGIYHSAYDTYEHYRRFSDTTFAYGVALSQAMATAIVRMADAPVLPFEFTNAARTYRGYVDEIEREAARKPETRGLDLSAVRASLDRLDRAAERYETVQARVEGMGEADLRRRRRQLAQVNRTLYQSERMLTDEAGLPGRDWFRHLIYAPGFYTGYGVKTMPGIREAVEDVPDGAVAQREAARVVAAIDRYTAQVERAADLLEAALR
jgi:N-acetylated-alpha-linked acidic dipeptidase